MLPLGGHSLGYVQCYLGMPAVIEGLSLDLSAMLSS